MPIYEYQCRACGLIFEEITTAAREDAPDCPSCGAKKAPKCISAAAVHSGEAQALSAARNAPKATSSGCGGSGGFS